MAGNISRVGEQIGPACRAGSEWNRVQPRSGPRSGAGRLHCRRRRSGGGVLLQCPFVSGCDRRHRAMEETRPKEHVAIGDLPRSDLCRHPLCAVLSRHSNSSASFGSSHFLHQLLLGSLADGSEGYKRESNHVRLPAWLLRIGCGRRRDGTATDSFEDFLRDVAICRHGDIRRRHLKHGAAALACHPLLRDAPGWRFMDLRHVALQHHCAGTCARLGSLKSASCLSLRISGKRCGGKHSVGICSVAQGRP